jgi:galactokinase
MDQLIVAAGHHGQALHIDCRSLTFDAIPVPRDIAILVLNSAAPRTLATSAYNVRRAQCESVVAVVASAFPDVRALRDVTQDMLHSVAGSLTHVEFMRARHVISENERVANTVEAMRTGDSGKLGWLMYQSHESLRRDYEVSSDELDLLVRLAMGEPGVLGARLTGAGFGGCVVAAVKTEFAPVASKSIIGQYRSRSGRDGSAFVSTASAGASVERL